MSEQPSGKTDAAREETGAGEFRTPMGKIAAALGLDRCSACGRQIGEEEPRHVRTGRVTWHDYETGQTGPHRHIREARCTDCGPAEEFDPEELNPEELDPGMMVA